MGKTIKEEPLYFTRKERRGSLFIIIIATIVTVGPYLWKRIFTTEQKPDDNSAQLAALATLKKDTTRNYASAYEERPYQSYNKQNQYVSQHETMDAALFSFDPNTISVDDWQRLGVKEKTAQSIQKYLAKGGKFRQPSDLKKIWGISPEKADQLIPYVNIAAAENKYSSSYASNTASEARPVYEKKRPALININAADTLGYANLPGIGAGYARRITKFRDKLGGFYSVAQVAETFGLPDSTYQKILPYLQVDGSQVKKINVNTATEETLKEHPYIRWQLAKVITAYKVQHGAFKKIEDLKSVMTITPDIYEKLTHYLVVD